MKHVLLSCVGLLVYASASVADPCVGATFDRPMDGAIDVVSYVSDVPSSQFPAFWQEGRLGGFGYKMFASSEAQVRSLDPVQDWGISVACDVADKTCAVTQEGSPPPEAIAASNRIGQCLLGEQTTVEPREQLEPTPPQTASQSQEQIPALQADEAAVEVSVAAPTNQTVVPRPRPIANVTPSATCGSGTLNEATEIATLQRLLVMAGEDPGPVDGFLGPKSFAAMEIFVEGANWDTSIVDVIALLDARLCGSTD